MTTRIRIRGKPQSQWQWELVTSDGHVANASQPFSSRAECEIDAKKQGLPVIGLARPPRASPGAAAAKKQGAPVGWTISSDGDGLWTWQHFNGGEEPVQSSRCAFLTEKECIADARKNGYSPDAAE